MKKIAASFANSDGCTPIPAIPNHRLALLTGELKSTATVLEMIALAQGFTDFASRDRVVVLRQENGETKRIPFNYRKVAAGDEQANLVVQSGDVIVVP